MHRKQIGWGLVVLTLGLAGPMAAQTNEELRVAARQSQIEVNQTVELSAVVDSAPGTIPRFEWRTSAGSLVPTGVNGEVDFLAPPEPQDVEIRVTVRLGGRTETRSLTISVLPEGALKETVTVLIEVDTAALQGVWVNADHPSENFEAPLRIKGTFRYDEESGEAFAGGSWPTYNMYDDGTHGDAVASDGIWSLAFEFEKTDAKVYFAFDDANEYRVEFESGLAWRLKLAWIDLDDFPDDVSNPAFVPDADKVLRFTADMAEQAGLYGPTN